MAWIGDGATSTGAFHEGLNFAAVQKIPLVVVAEDNKYAYSTPIAKQMAITRIDERAAPTAFRTSWSTATTCSRCTTSRSGWSIARAPASGASLIGVDTMRMQGHAQHDDARYVPKATARGVGGEGSARAVHEGADRARRGDARRSSTTSTG